MSSLSKEAGVATMVEYIMITGILMALFIVMLILVNTNFMEGPSNAITYSAFTDISNGISTRIVDTYAIAPVTGNITSQFDIPDDIAGRDYSVEISSNGEDSSQSVTISRGMIVANVAIAGIGSTRKAGGTTTGRGLNRIGYCSGGYGPAGECLL